MLRQMRRTDHEIGQRRQSLKLHCLNDFVCKTAAVSSDNARLTMQMVKTAEYFRHCFDPPPDRDTEPNNYYRCEKSHLKPVNEF